MGRPFDYTTDNGSGYIAASGLAMLPSPDSPGLEVQKHFVLPSARSRPGEPAPFGYHGYMDCWLPNGGLPDMPPDSKVQITDFKCTSNPDGFWVKTAETLGDDVQAMLYATWALYSTGARFVDLVWLYFATRGRRRVKRVWRRVDREHVAARFLAIDAVASELVALKLKKPDPLSLPPSPTACDNFGGCPHRATCNLGPGDNADSYAAKHSIKGDTQMDFGQLFSNLQAKAADTTPAPAAVAPPAKVVRGTTHADDAMPIKSDGSTVFGVGINPPESNLPPAPAVGAIAAPVAPDAATTVAPAKRTRRTKAEMEAARAAAGEVEPEACGGGFDRAPEGSTATTTIINNSTPAAPIETVTVTWSEERFSPVSFQSFGVGPFTITGALVMVRLSCPNSSAA
jgi:hypothetical protein